MSTATATAHRRRRPFWHTVVASAGVALATALGFWTSAGAHDAVWIVPVVMVVAIVIHLPAGGAARDGSVPVAVVGAVGGFVLGILPFGLSLDGAVDMAVVNLATALVIGAAYHRLARREGWWLDEPQDVVLLGALALVGGLVLVALGGTPESGVPRAPGPAGMVPEALAVASDLVVALLVGLPSLSRTRPVLRTDHRMMVPLLLPVWVACVVVPMVFPGMRNAWILLVPALWGGLSLTLRWASLAAVAQLTLLEILYRLPWTQTDTGAADSVVDLLVVFSVGLLFVLVVYRERAARLALELHRRAEQEAVDGAVLDGVIRTMKDGVILTDAGRVVMTNPSARRLLGLTHTDLTLPEWLDEQGFCDEDGSPPQVHSGFLTTPVDGFTRLTLRTPYRPGAEDRRYDMAVRSVVVQGRQLALLVVRDGTEGYTRQQQLKSSAGAVAGDLKAPLAKVRRWIDSAAGHLASGDLDAGGYALAQAEMGTMRMRGMIDDYLALTVAREGVLRAGAVALGQVIDEVVAEVPDPAIVVDEIDTPHLVQADLSLTRRLIANLLADAARGRSEDAPVHVRFRSERGEPGWVRIAVEHDALPEADEESIFGLRDEAVEAGTGPGMDLCRAVVGRHGGRLETGVADDGAPVVWFTLPLSEEVVEV